MKTQIEKKQNENESLEEKYKNKEIEADKLSQEISKLNNNINDLDLKNQKLLEEN